MGIPDSTSPEASISVSSCCSLASEVWRLGLYIDSLGEKPEAVSLRYSLRQLSRVLAELQITVIDLTDTSYDSGMIQEVVEVVEDASLSAGEQLIAETISPTVAIKKFVVQMGQVTLRRSPFAVSDQTEVDA